MNKTERIRKLNEVITWCVQYNYSNSLQERFDSYDAVIQALRVAKAHWLRLEENRDTEVSLFSMLCEEAINYVNAVLASVTENFSNEYQQVVNSVNSNTGLQAQNVGGGTTGRTILLPLGTPTLNNDSTDIYDYGYKELYLQGKTTVFNRFIELQSGSRQITNSLNNSANPEIFEAVIQYLALAMRKYTYPTSKLITRERMQDLSEDIAASKQTLADLREDTEKFIDAEAERAEKYIDTQNKSLAAIKQDVDDWHRDKDAKLVQLEATYNEKLKLEAPVDYWNQQADEKEESFKSWMKWTAIVSSALVVFVAVLFCVVYSQPEGVAEQYVPLSFIVIALIAMLIYAVKTLVKLTLTERHLATEFREKAMFTHFYLSLLLNSDDKIGDQERLLIYNTLFEKAETGLIKASADSDLGVVALIKALGK